MPNPKLQSYDGDGGNDEPLILVMAAVNKNVNVKSVGVLKSVVSKDKFIGKPNHMVLFNQIMVTTDFEGKTIPIKTSTKEKIITLVMLYCNL